mgnify:CR=1 FL=1
MTTKKLTKLLALYLPYILLGLVATNFGEAWRLAEGKELGDKIMAMMGTIPLAFANPLLSLHPLDLLIGFSCGAGLTARRIFAEQKCKEVPSWNGVRLCTMGHRQGY